MKVIRDSSQDQSTNLEGDIVCWVSGGIASTMACYKFQQDNPTVRLRFVCIAIPESEHPDHHRFIREIGEFFGWPIEFIKSKKYNSHWDVIEKVRFINGPRGAACTRILKIETRLEWQKENNIRGHVWGFTSEETSRYQRRKSEQGFEHFAPLLTDGWTKQKCMEEFIRLTEGKIAPPVVYSMGLPNANCIGCAKGGAGYWNLIRVKFPNEFERMAKLERAIGATVLRKRVKQLDGSFKTVPLYLEDLDPSAGRNKPVVIPDCSSDGCEIALSREFENAVEED